MVLRFKIKLVRLAVIAQRLVILLAARLEIGVGEIGEGEHQCAVFRLDLGQRLVVFRNLRLQLRHTFENRRDILARLFLHRDFLRDAVLLRLVRFRFEDQRTALCVQLQNTVNLCVAIDLLCPKPCLDCLGIVLDSLDIQHVFHLK